MTTAGRKRDCWVARVPWWEDVKGKTELLVKLWHDSGLYFCMTVRVIGSEKYFISLRTRENDNLFDLRNCVMNRLTELQQLNDYRIDPSGERMDVVKKEVLVLLMKLRLGQVK